MGATTLIDEQRARVFCLVAAEQADVLLAPLREHFAGEPEVAVMVERRTANRADRPIAERDPARAIPPELRREAPHLRLVQPMEPVRRTYEDAGLPELIDRSVAGDPEAVSELWWRVSERVLSRLRRVDRRVRSRARDEPGARPRARRAPGLRRQSASR